MLGTLGGGQKAQLGVEEKRQDGQGEGGRVLEENLGGFWGEQGAQELKQ